MSLSTFPNHHSEPVALALRHVTDTRRLLQRLITSSESFDYPTAKIALEALANKVDELQRLEKKFQLDLSPREHQGAGTIIPFREK